MDEVALIRALRAAGASDALIAEARGITRQRVHQLAGPRPRAPTRPPAIRADAPATDLPQALLAWRMRHGLDAYEAAAVLRVHHATIRRWEQGIDATGVAPRLVLLVLSLLDGKAVKKLRSDAN